MKPRNGLLTPLHNPCWSTARFKFLFERVSRPTLETDYVVTAFRDGEVTLRSNRREDGFTFADKEIGYQGVEPGDLVIHAMDGFAGAIGLSESRGKVSPVCTTVVPIDAREVEPRFWAYYLRNLAVTGFIQSLAKGIRERSTDFRWKDAGNLLVNFPNCGAQTAIADFLDRETARIDRLVEKKKRLSILLDEKLTDDVLQAVTIGINASIQLVPENELEWTLYRPEHWRVVRLKHFFRENTQYSVDGEETLFSLRMKEGLVPHNDVSDKEILPDDLIGYKKVFSGQIVMNRMRAAIGLFGLADREGIVSPDYSIFDVSQEAHAGYFLRLFKTEPMKAAFRLLSKGLGTGHSGFMRLNSDNFGRIRVAVPCFEEQQEISRYVEIRISRVTELQNRNQVSIDRLREYRAALITAAVTGQIDVTTWGKAGTTDRRLDRIEAEIPQEAQA